MKKNRKWIALVLGIGLVLYFIFRDTLNQPDTSDLPGGFNELAFKRNEQNDGPVIRVYAASVSEPANAAYQSYGNLMPHNKYGTTIVFFFGTGEEVPEQLSWESPYYDTTRYKPLARYEKNAMGNSRLLLLR